jgi:hypothetical protein
MPVNEPGQRSAEIRAAGYEALIARYELDVISNWHRSFVAAGSPRRIETPAGIIGEVYPLKYWPGDSHGGHLEFALKYDGTNLAVLSSLFSVMPTAEVLAYVRSKPTGKYARRLWLLYEFLTGSTLPLDDLNRGNYVDLLDSQQYYTVSPARQIRRQRVNDNLLGDSRFCPTIRRTEALRGFEEAALTERCKKARDGVFAGSVETGLELSVHQGNEIIFPDRTHPTELDAHRTIRRAASACGEKRLL